MLTTNLLTVAGRPQFLDPLCERAASSDGISAAWQLAFESQGVKALDRVKGSFAVAMQLTDGRVLMAVDRFGIESLCYRIESDRIHSSQRADSLATPSTPLDPQALFDYLYHHVIPSPRTIFRGVMRLPPGHCAVFDQGHLTVAPYWTPGFEQARSPGSFSQLRDEFRGLLQKAVADQLDSSKPACFLSGGTDSSTVAGSLMQVAGSAASYSIGFDADGYDEMAYARLAARHFGTEHHEYYVTPEDLLRSIPDVAAHYDQPFGNSSAVPAFYCARMAQQDGVQRILAGDGGDELFGGNTRYAKQRVFGWYDAVPTAVRGVVEPVFGNGAVAALPLLGKVSSYIRQAKVPMPERIQSYNLLQRLGIEQVLTPDFLAAIDVQGPIAQQRAVWAESQGHSLLDRQLAFDWRYTLAENDLPKVCGTTALAGLTVGFPMLSQELVDFSLRLPAHHKLRGLKLRWFFKEALRGFLPDEIITKKKQGFGLPFGVWAHRHAGLNALARDSLNSLATRNLVQPAFIQRLLDVHLAKHPGYYGEMIWILMMLEHWLRKHAPSYRAARH